MFVRFNVVLPPEQHGENVALVNVTDIVSLEPAGKKLTVVYVRNGGGANRSFFAHGDAWWMLDKLQTALDSVQPTPKRNARGGDT